jgi:hypothetical protein
LLTAADVNFQRKSDAHLYRLVRELTPGNGSIDDMGRAVTTFMALLGGGSTSFACCCLFVV